jgi:hypothetical protein
MIGGRRQPSRQAKLCIGNAQLRQLVARYALDQLRRHPSPGTASRWNPATAVGWLRVRRVRRAWLVHRSRMVVLANEKFADAVDYASFPAKVVGFYAYAQHSPRRRRCVCAPGGRA